MALTDGQICSIALQRIGQRQVVDDLNENTSAARACKVYYAGAREALLASFPWPWATRRSVLAATAATAPTGWGYAYVMPADCAVARYVYPGTRNPSPDQRVPFARELGDDALGNPTVRLLLTDLSPATLVYTALVTNSTLFPPLFADALAWRMASDLCLAIPVEPQVGLQMQAGYAQAMRAAAGSQLRQQQLDVKPESSFVRGR